jgi:hypothetical protein
MGWQGYWILALWDYKDSDESFGQLWRAYWKALTAGIKLFDSGFYWRDGIPYRSKQTSQMVSVEVGLDSDGYIHWYWVLTFLQKFKKFFIGFVALVFRY